MTTLSLLCLSLFHFLTWWLAELEATLLAHFYHFCLKETLIFRVIDNFLQKDFHFFFENFDNHIPPTFEKDLHIFAFTFELPQAFK